MGPTEGYSLIQTGCSKRIRSTSPSKVVIFTKIVSVIVVNKKIVTSFRGSTRSSSLSTPGFGSLLEPIHSFK